MSGTPILGRLAEVVGMEQMPKWLEEEIAKQIARVIMNLRLDKRSLRYAEYF